MSEKDDIEKVFGDIFKEAKKEDPLQKYKDEIKKLNEQLKK